MTSSAASCTVVVPAVMPIAAPDPMSTAAEAAIGALLGGFCEHLASKPGSSVLCS